MGHSGPLSMLRPAHNLHAHVAHATGILSPITSNTELLTFPLQTPGPSQVRAMPSFCDLSQSLDSFFSLPLSSLSAKSNDSTFKIHPGFTYFFSPPLLQGGGPSLYSHP